MFFKEIIMADLRNFDPNSPSRANSNIFGLPFSLEEAKLVLLPVPWEVTVSYCPGTARSPERIFKSSTQVDLFDSYFGNQWKKGFYMKPVDKKVLMKSDYLRKEAELYIDYITKGEAVEKNKFMCKSLKDINEGSQFLNNWVYEQCKALLDEDKLVGLVGGDHSTPAGFYRALGEKYESFGFLHIDAHCDLRKSYEDFTYSHASVMYNALKEVPQISKLVQVGIRDYCEEEWNFMCNSEGRVKIFLDEELKDREFRGEQWEQITNDIINQLPQQVYLSFDIDGLKHALCPNTGTPVPGGFELEQVKFLLKKLLESGRKLIGFDLVEVGNAETDWDSNVGARVLFFLCNCLMKSNT